MVKSWQLICCAAIDFLFPRYNLIDQLKYILLTSTISISFRNKILKKKGFEKR